MTDLDPSGARTEQATSVELALLDLLVQLDRAASPTAKYAALDNALAKLVGFDRIVVGSVDATTHRLRVIHQRGDTVGLPDRYETLPSDHRSLIHAPITQGMSVLHTLHPERDIYRGDAMRRRAGMIQTLVSPIISGGSVTGLIMLNSTESDRYSVETTTIVEAFARILGLVLASNPGLDVPRPASQVIADTLARIATAETATEVVDCLFRGVEAATGASIIRCRLLDDGSYTYADGHLAAGATLGDEDIETVGRALAAAIGPMIDTDIGTGTIPQRAIVTDLPIGEDAPARVHGLDSLPDLAAAGAVVIAPLHAARTVLGALVAIWPDTLPAELLPSHARAIFSFSDLAGPALHRIVLLARLEQRLAEAETIRRLTESIARTPRLEDALDIISRTSRIITGVDFVAVAEATPDHVIWHSVSGARDPSFLHQRLPGPSQVLSTLLAHHQEVLIEDARHHPEYSPELMPVHTAEGLRSTAIIPVYVNARLRATLLFGRRRPHVFTPDELTTFHSIAAAAATAVASADARIRTSDGK